MSSPNRDDHRGCLPVILLARDPELAHALAETGLAVRMLESPPPPALAILVAPAALARTRWFADLVQAVPERVVLLAQEDGHSDGSPCEVVARSLPARVAAAVRRASAATIDLWLARHRDDHREVLFVLHGRPPAVVAASGSAELQARAPSLLEALLAHAKVSEFFATTAINQVAGEIGVPCPARGWSLFGFELSRLGSPAQSSYSLRLQDRRDEWLAALQRDRERRFDDLAILAGSLAHDFNNLLQVITTQAELIALDSAGRRPDLDEPLAQIERAAEQGTELTKRVLAFSRARSVAYEVLDLRELARDAARWFRGDGPSVARLKITACKGPVPVEVDRVQLRQAIVELLRAVKPRTGTGSITLSVSRALPRGLMRHGLRPRGRLTLRCPRPPEMALFSGEALFDPLVSLDRGSFGADLGSALAYRVVHTHGGRIEADLDRKDLVIRIVLPLVDHKPVTRIAAEGRELLLVDVDAAVVTAGEALFERCGFLVRTAHRGEDALQLLRRHGSGIAVAVLDLIMPGMPASDLFGEIRRHWPHVKVVLATGYGLAAEQLPAVDGYLEKPFRREDIE